MQTEKIISSI